ncbi:MAG: NRDE family protein [Verrucomicrobiota bacterium]
MCTFSWWPTPGGYGFLFNRDELNTRGPELPPVVAVGGGVARIAPRDADSGGTWLGVNDHGIGVVLLNDYTVDWRPASPTQSRGRLVSLVLGARTPAAAGRLVADFELGSTGAFHLIVLGRNAEAHVHHWNGERLDHFSGDGVDQFFSSSSYRPAEVIAGRRARYELLPDKADENALRALHWSHDPAAGAHSVLMRRPDAATRSVCEAAVGPDEATLAYTPVVWSGDALAASRTEILTLALK